jgi:hypothetical protein
VVNRGNWMLDFKYKKGNVLIILALYWEVGTQATLSFGSDKNDFHIYKGFLRKEDCTNLPDFRKKLTLHSYEVQHVAKILNDS